MIPRASLVTTFHNRADYLSRAIVSVLEQSFGDFELILFDDGSTDESAEIAARYAALDPRIRLFRAPHQGRVRALREAFSLCRAPFLALLDSDDRLETSALAETVPLLEENPTIGVLYTDYLEIDAADRVLGYGRRCSIPYTPQRLLVDFMTFHFRLMRRTEIDKAGGIDLSLERAVDYDLCLRLSEITTFAHLPRPLYFYRLHEGSISGADFDEQAKSSLEAVRRAIKRRGLDEIMDVERGEDGKLRLRPKSNQGHSPSS